MHIRYITKLLPSIVRYTAYLGTKSHIPFLFTLKYFTQNTIQLKMSSLPSCTCYPQILHHTFCPITPIVVAYFRWSFQNLLPSDTTPDMQEKNYKIQFSVTLKIASKNSPFQMSIYGCLAWNCPGLFSVLIYNCIFILLLYIIWNKSIKYIHTYIRNEINEWFFDPDHFGHKSL